MKRASGDSNSHSAVHHPTLQREHDQKPPSHLYLRGNVFYFRYALPPRLKEALSCSEIRLSLLTPYVYDARKYATALTSCLESMLISETDLDITKIKAKLNEKLDELIAQQEKDSTTNRYTSAYEIRRRINNATNNILKNDNYSIKSKEETKSLCGLNSSNIEEVLEHILNSYISHIYKTPEKIVDILFQSIAKKILSEKILSEDILSKFIDFKSRESKYIEVQINNFQSENNKFDNCKTIDNNRQMTKEDAQHLLLSELINKYIELKISDGKWTNENITTYKSRICTIIDILGDIPADSITRDMMRQYRDTLRKLPAQRKVRKEYRDKTIQELLEIDIPEEKLINVKTVNIMVEAVSGMFEKAIQEGWLNISINPAKKLQIEDKRLNIELRNAFTQDEICYLFFSGDYKIENFKNPAYYWIPLIGSLSGMRLEEISQLYCEDIQQEDGIWYFDIKTTDANGNSTEKLLKNKNAIRCVPIHDYLIQNNFIQYVEGIKNKGYTRIFYQLKKSDKTFKYGKQAGKAFSKYLEKKGIKNSKLTFHSLRHSFADYFNKRGLNNDIFFKFLVMKTPSCQYLNMAVDSLQKIAMME